MQHVHGVKSENIAAMVGNVEDILAPVYSNPQGCSFLERGGEAAAKERPFVETRKFDADPFREGTRSAQPKIQWKTTYATILVWALVDDATPVKNFAYETLRADSSLCDISRKLKPRARIAQ